MSWKQEESDGVICGSWCNGEGVLLNFSGEGGVDYVARRINSALPSCAVRHRLGGRYIGLSSQIQETYTRPHRLFLEFHTSSFQGSSPSSRGSSSMAFKLRRMRFLPSLISPINTRLPHPPLRTPILLTIFKIPSALSSFSNNPLHPGLNTEPANHEPQPPNPNDKRNQLSNTRPQRAQPAYMIPP